MLLKKYLHIHNQVTPSEAYIYPDRVERIAPSIIISAENLRRYYACMQRIAPVDILISTY